MTLTMLLSIIAAGMAGLAVLTVVYGVRTMASRDANVDARAGSARCRGNRHTDRPGVRDPAATVSAW